MANRERVRGCGTLITSIYVKKPPLGVPLTAGLINLAQKASMKFGDTQNGLGVGVTQGFWEAF